MPHLYETCPAHSSPLMPTKVSSTMSMGSKGISLPRQGRGYQGTLLLPSSACFCRDCLHGPGKSLTHAVTYAAARVLLAGRVKRVLGASWCELRCLLSWLAQERGGPYRRMLQSHQADQIRKKLPGRT